MEEVYRPVVVVIDSGTGVFSGNVERYVWTSHHGLSFTSKVTPSAEHGAGIISIIQRHCPKA